MSDEQVVALYLELKDSQRVGIIAHCAPDTVRQLVRAAGHEVLPRGGLPDRKSLLIDPAEMERRYRQGEAAAAIAQAAGTYPAKVYRILRERGVHIRDQHRAGGAATAKKLQEAKRARDRSR